MGNSKSKLKKENERLNRENLALKSKLEKLSPSTTTKKSTSSNNNSYVQPKAKARLIPPPKPTSAKSTQPPPQVNKPKSTQYSPYNDYKSHKPDFKIVGTYVPPSMNKNGDIFDRINQTIKLKNNMKQTLDDIYNRLIKLKKAIDNIDIVFANNPTPQERKRVLELITQVLLLRQGFKDIDNYPEIFKKEVKEKGIKFSPDEQEKFDDYMIILGKFFPYSLTPYHQKIDHLLIQTIHNFFIEKNLRFYKPKELEDILWLKEKVRYLN